MMENWVWPTPSAARFGTPQREAQRHSTKRRVRRGDERHPATNSAYVYDPQADAGTQLASMSIARRVHASAAVGGKLYVFCGYSTTSELEPCSVGVSECRAVSGQCRGSVEAVSVDTGVRVSSSVGTESEQCRSSVGQCRGFLTDDLLDWCQAVSECRSVGVSGCRAVSGCRSVGVSRPYELLTTRLI